MYGFNSFTTSQQASYWLQAATNNNLLAYPTESVWGIGCDAMNQEAVQQILTIKNRPIEKGLIVVTDSIQRIEPLLSNVTKQQRRIISDSWSEDCGENWNNSRQISNASRSSSISITKKQAMTWLLPIPDGLIIPSWITGKHNSVAVRVIAHPLIKQVCCNMVSENNPFGFIISTSCNPTNIEPARTLQEAKSYFANFSNIGYLQAETLGYDLPSQICDGLSGLVIR